MKIKFLIITAISIFLSLIIFVVSTSLMHLQLESQAYVGGGSIDLDPDLSPSYVYDHHGSLSFNSIFVAGPIILGIISLLFLVPHIIFRIKKIPSRKYMSVIAASILIFFGLSYVQNGIQSIMIVDHLEQENDWVRLIGGLITIGMGSIFIMPGIALLKKAKLKIRK